MNNFVEILYTWERILLIYIIFLTLLSMRKLVHIFLFFFFSFSFVFYFLFLNPTYQTKGLSYILIYCLKWIELIKIQIINFLNCMNTMNYEVWTLQSRVKEQQKDMIEIYYKSYCLHVFVLAIIFYKHYSCARARSYTHTNYITSKIKHIFYKTYSKTYILKHGKWKKKTLLSFHVPRTSLDGLLLKKVATIHVQLIL